VKYIYYAFLIYCTKDILIKNIILSYKECVQVCVFILGLQWTTRCSIQKSQSGNYSNNSIFMYRGYAH